MTVQDHLLHTPDDRGVACCEQIRLRAIEFEAVMDALCPASQELTNARHYLEMARMWAIKAIVMQYPAQPLTTIGGGAEPAKETAPHFQEKRAAAGLRPEPEGPEPDLSAGGADTDLSETSSPVGGVTPVGVGVEPVMDFTEDGAIEA